MSTITSGTATRATTRHLSRVVTWIVVAAVIVAIAATAGLLAHRAASSDLRAAAPSITAPAQRADAPTRHLEQLNASPDEMAAQSAAWHVLRSN
jgi:hypothetical protein